MAITNLTALGSKAARHAIFSAAALENLFAAGRITD